MVFYENLSVIPINHFVDTKDEKNHSAHTLIIFTILVFLFNEKTKLLNEFP